MVGLWVLLRALGPISRSSSDTKNPRTSYTDRCVRYPGIFITRESRVSAPGLWVRASSPARDGGANYSQSARWLAVVSTYAAGFVITRESHPADRPARYSIRSLLKGQEERVFFSWPLNCMYGLFAPFYHQTGVKVGGVKPIPLAGCLLITEALLVSPEEAISIVTSKR